MALVDEGMKTPKEIIEEMGLDALILLQEYNMLCNLSHRGELYRTMRAIDATRLIVIGLEEFLIDEDKRWINFIKNTGAF